MRKSSVVSGHLEKPGYCSRQILMVWLVAAISTPVSSEVPALGNYSTVQQQSARIHEANVVCASNSITGQFVFTTPFAGKIYSSRYANVHDCVYYNHYGESSIMFTVPNYKCGTVVLKNSQNIISHIENEVYVQFDKDTQNVEDKRFLFICDRVEYTPTRPQTTRGIYRETIQPSQTIIVETIEATRISVTGGLSRPASGLELNSSGGSSPQPYVWMEIEDGAGPGKPPVQRPLRLGDQVTLVVTGRAHSSGKQYDMQVYGCFASDGSGQNKIQLIDDSGCALKPTVASKMMRMKNSSEITYFLPVKAFKFPTTEDVYFSCTVEICSTCNFSEPCPSGHNATNRTRRTARSEVSFEEENALKSIQLHDYVKIMDSTDVQALRSDPDDGRSEQKRPGCINPSLVIVLLTIIAALLAALICLALFLVFLLRQKNSI